MKVLPANFNYNSPIYPQNQNSTNRNVNFGAKLVLRGNILRYESLNPKSATLREKFLKTKFGRACGQKLIDFFEEAFLKKVPLQQQRRQKIRIYIDSDEQSQLSDLIKNASTELGISLKRCVAAKVVSDNTFNQIWNDKATACAKLRHYVEALIKNAEGPLTLI